MALFRQKQWLLIAALLLCAGCGGPTLYQVKGTVVYKDDEDVAVLAGGLVHFQPEDPEVKVSVRGEIQPDGSFQMSTVHPGDGVPPGKYRVMLSPPSFRGHRDDPRPILMDGRFQDFETSGLKITVEGSITDYVITVDKPR